MVLDRFFLWVFTIACIAGTCVIICQAPSLYDQRMPIDQYFNGTVRKNFTFPVPNIYNSSAEKEDSTF